MTRDELKLSLETIPDFPVPGVKYKDVTSLLTKPDAFRTTVDSIVDFAKANYITDIVALMLVVLFGLVQSH